jgi:hypothetical protein
VRKDRRPTGKGTDTGTSAGTSAGTATQPHSYSEVYQVELKRQTQLAKLDLEVLA